MLGKKTFLCIEALAAIGSAPPGVWLTTQTLSLRLGVSVSHLEGILRLLRQAGLVQAVRGPGGGYCIARDPGLITVWSVVQAVGTPEESTPAGGTTPTLTDALDRALHEAAQDYLSSRTMDEFIRAESSWQARSAAVGPGLGLRPMPERWLPRAPNSVFQLSTFLQAAAA